MFDDECHSYTSSLMSIIQQGYLVCTAVTVYTQLCDCLAVCKQGQAKDGAQSAVPSLDKAWPSAQQAVQAAINTLKPQTSPLPHKDE